MSNVHYLTCPECGMKYYISMELLHSGLPTVCPRCHHEYAPTDGGARTAAAGKPGAKHS